MVPTAFDEENGVLDPPPGVSTEECEALSVFRGKLPSNIPVVISCWKLTTEEWEEVRKTGRVWLAIAGHTMPPAFVTGQKPVMTKE